MRERERKETIERIIELCREVAKQGTDPFQVKVAELFKRLRDILPYIKDWSEFYMDLEAVGGLSDIVFQQGEWVKYRSSMLYLDPLLIILKLNTLSPNELADVLRKAWHPIVGIESITMPGLRKGAEYWTNLPKLGEGGGELAGAGGELEHIGADRMAELGFLEKNFDQTLNELFTELKTKAGKGGIISYWKFINADKFEQTVKRAWLVSFLVSYGMATMEVKPLEDEILLKPLKKAQAPGGQGTSITIPVSKERWREMNG